MSRSESERGFPWTVWIFYHLVRVSTLLAFKMLYRLRVHGAEKLPPEGGVLLASNHGSLMDPVLLGGISSRMVVITLARASLGVEEDLERLHAVLDELASRSARRRQQNS